MSHSTWILLLYTLWLPASLLSQPALVSDSASNQVDTVHTGMAVFGKVLGIHGADTLAVQGDLILVEAEIVGEGTLSLCASQPQRITARKSSVQHLHIDNPTKVTVQGELTIQKSLVVESGVVDSRMAKFVLSDSCCLHIQAGGHVLWQETPLLVKQAKDVPQTRLNSLSNWATVWQELIRCKTALLPTSIQFAHQPFKWLHKARIPLSPPPESRNKAAIVSRA